MTTPSGRSWQAIPLGKDFPAPKGAYSPLVQAGDLLFVSGQVPRDRRTGALLGDDVATQTRATLSNVGEVLAAAGATLADIVSVTVHLQNADDWGVFDRTYREVMQPPYPTRTAVGADLRDVLVEITAIAVRPGARPR